MKNKFKSFKCKNGHIIKIPKEEYEAANLCWGGFIGCRECNDVIILPPTDPEMIKYGHKTVMVCERRVVGD